MQGIHLNAIELIGEATRIPQIQEYIKSFIASGDMPLSRTLNSQECVAKGCAIAAAQACGHYQSRTGSLSYQIAEYNQYEVAIQGNLQMM